MYGIGSEVHWSPPGFRIFLDTSWDGSGSSMACRVEDILAHQRGNALSLGKLTLKTGAPALFGKKVFLLRAPGQSGNHGLGYSTEQRITQGQAEAIFAANTQRSE